jgi:hypothetical protein
VDQEDPEDREDPEDQEGREDPEDREGQEDPEDPEDPEDREGRADPVDQASQADPEDPADGAAEWAAGTASVHRDKATGKKCMAFLSGLSQTDKTRHSILPETQPSFSCTY